MKFKVGDKVRMWNIEGRWQETLGERVYTVTEVHEDWEAQSGTVVSVEFRCEHCGYVAVAQEFIAHDSDWFVKVEPEPAPREWMDAAEAVKTLDCDTTVWGWSNGDCVRRWYLFEGRWFTTDDTTPLSWGVDHQPTHVMIRGEGEEPPAPPVVEPTLYEKIKAICKASAEELPETSLDYIWNKRQYAIWKENIELWHNALNSANNLIIGRHDLDDYEHKWRLVCEFALKLAKERE